MKIKIYVTIALLLATFVALSILIMGFVGEVIFPYIYFMFALFFLLILISAIRPAFTKSELGVLLFVSLIVAFSLTLAGVNAKSYFSTASQYSPAHLASLTNTNDYYASYINSLNAAILNVTQTNQNLQDRINSINLNPPVPQQTPQPTPVIIPAQPNITTPTRGGERSDD